MLVSLLLIATVSLSGTTSVHAADTDSAALASSGCQGIATGGGIRVTGPINYCTYNCPAGAYTSTVSATAYVGSVTVSGCGGVSCTTNALGSGSCSKSVSVYVPTGGTSACTASGIGAGLFACSA